MIVVDQSLPPELKQRYEFRAVLGSGGMGTVYCCWDRTVRREVALKLLHIALAGQLEQARFRREARYLARLAHPGIVRLYDASFSGTVPYLVMERLQGQSLAGRIGLGIMPPIDVAALLCGILDALDQVHSAGILHRDIKPSNVFLRGGCAPVLVDFGLVRSTALGETLLTAQGACVGTPMFMPPELVSGHAATVPSDIYQVALIGYEALTGQNLHGSDHSRSVPGLESILSSILSGTYFHVAARVLSSQGAMGTVLLQALHPDPARRFASAAEMAHALHAAAAPERVRCHEDQPKPVPAVRPQPAASFPHRSGPWMPFVVLVLAGALWLMLRRATDGPVSVPTSPPSMSQARSDSPITTRAARSRALLARLQEWSKRSDVTDLARRMEGLATTKDGQKEAASLLQSILEGVSIAPGLGSLEMAPSAAGPAGQDLYWHVFRFFTLERIVSGEWNRLQLRQLFPMELRPGVLPPAGARQVSCSLAGTRALGTPGLLRHFQRDLPGLEPARVREVSFALNVSGLAEARRAWLVLQVGRLTRSEFITIRVNADISLGLTTSVARGTSTTVSHALPPWVFREGPNQLVARLDSLPAGQRSTELVRCTLFLE